jgi:hypothetical protein
LLKDGIAIVGRSVGASTEGKRTDGCTRTARGAAMHAGRPSIDGACRYESLTAVNSRVRNHDRSKPFGFVIYRALLIVDLFLKPSDFFFLCRVVLLLRFLLEFLVFCIQRDVFIGHFDDIGVGVFLIVLFVKQAHFVSAVKT